MFFLFFGFGVCFFAVPIFCSLIINTKELIFINMSYTKAIQKMIDEGNDILHIAKLFGGIERLLELSKSSPYLKALIQTKLGGQLHCSAEGEDEVMVPFSLNFIITDLEVLDMDDIYHYNASVNIIIPEIKNSPALMFMLSSWLEDYLSDMGAEVGAFNDSNLNNKMIWIYAKSINGMSFKDRTGGVSDTEVLEIIPQEYKGD
jgi:hypothetical protein